MSRPRTGGHGRRGVLRHRPRDRRGPGGPPVPRSEAGQASVETVAIAPVVALVVTALAVGLSSHRAGEAAGLAAHAAGLAAMQGRDPEDAARAAVPDVARDRLRIDVDGARIAVRVRAEGPRALVGSFDAVRRVVARRGAGS